MPATGGTIICNSTTYIASDPLAVFDPGIEYDFGNSANDYTIDLPGAYIDIHTTAEGDHALYGRHGGEGDLTIRMGTISDLIGRGANAHGLYGHHTGSGDLTIDLMDGFYIEGRGADAHAIYGHHTGSGALDIRVRGIDKTVLSTHGNAIRLESASAKALTLGNVRIKTEVTNGDAILFSDSTDDTLTIIGTGTTTIEGNVAMGDGSGDQLVLNACEQADVDDANDTDCTTAYGDLALSHTNHDGTFTGLENITKIGSGLAHLTDLDADGAMLSLEDGKLRIDGHLDLGATGELTIHDQTRLIFSGRNVTVNNEEQFQHATITANKVKFDSDSWQKLYLATGGMLAANSDLLLSEGTGAGKFYASDGDTEVTPGLYDQHDTLLATTISSDGVVSTALSLPENQCGPIPTSDPFTIICNWDTYAHDDATNLLTDIGIEYDFGNSANDYTIHLSEPQIWIVLSTTAEEDHGVYGRHAGSGNLTVSMSADSDSIAKGANAHAIYGHHTGSGDLTIDLSNGYWIRAEGSGGHGIYGHHEGATGALDVRVRNITGSRYVRSVQGDAIRLEAGFAKTLTLGNARIETQAATGHAVLFTGSTDDTLTIVGTGTTELKGNVAMGDGTGDTLVFNTCLEADVGDANDADCTTAYGDLALSHTNHDGTSTGLFTGLENITKIGSGLARLTNLDADGAMLWLQDGSLRLDGHLDLGATGELTIHDQTRLILGFRSVENDNYGHITANKVKFDDFGWQKLYLEGGVIIPANSGVDLLRETGSGAGTFYAWDGSNGVEPELYDLNDMRLATVESDGDVTAAISTDDPECGAILTSASFTITCDETTYTLSTRGDDAGIEYDFGTSANDYTIHYVDSPNDERGFSLLTTEAEDHGLHARHAGDGNLTIAMTGGSIQAQGAGAHGVYGVQSGSGSLTVNVTDGRITTYGGDVIRLEAGTAKTLTLSNSSVQMFGSGGAAIRFGDATADTTADDTDDTLTIAGGGRTNTYGNVEFGDGNDTLVFDTCLAADVADTGDTDCTAATGDLEYTNDSGWAGFNGLEHITKIGSGLARLDRGTLNANGAMMALKDGKLHLDGLLNLGATGELTIHDQTRLIFGFRSITDYGDITANKVKFDNAGWQKLYLAGGVTVPAGSELDLLRSTGSGAGKFYASDGATEVTPGLYDLGDALLTTVTSDGVVSVSIGISTDDPECGAIPTSDPFTITCDETTYTLSTRGDDAGIEYDFGDSANNYTINLRDLSTDPDSLSISTTKDDHGLHARHGGDGNLTIAMTSGSIMTTEGSFWEPSHGIYGEHSGSGALALGISGGSISTGGSWNHGIHGTHSGSADIDIDIAGGAIATLNENGYAVFGDHTGSGDVDIDMTAGSILTEGRVGIGIAGRRSTSGNIAIDLTSAIPAGTCNGTDHSGCDIHTRGTSGYGIYAEQRYVSSDSSSTLAIGMAGGAILTEGDNARGIIARAYGGSAIAIAMSGGTIRTGFGSDSGEDAASGRDAEGIRVEHRGSGATTVTLSGSRIHTKGDIAEGIELHIDGYEDEDGVAASARVEMSGGRIDTEGDAASGIYGLVDRGGRLDIAMSGGDIRTQGAGSHGIWGGHSGDGRLDIAVTGGSIITTASDANPIHFSSSTATRLLALRSATVESRHPGGSHGTAIHFGGDGDDSLGIWGHDDAGMTATTVIRGDVAFGGGDDRLVFDSRPGDIGLVHSGAFTGLENIRKTGSGTLRLADMRAENATMSLEAGDLRLRGHLDLGSGGSLTVYHASRLIFGKTDSGHGRITASSVKINGIAQRLYAEATDTLSAGNDVLLGSGVFRDTFGNSMTPKLIDLSTNAEISTFNSYGCLLASDGSCQPPGSGDDEDTNLWPIDTWPILIGDPDIPVITPPELVDDPDLPAPPPDVEIPALPPDSPPNIPWPPCPPGGACIAQSGTGPGSASERPDTALPQAPERTPAETPQAPKTPSGRTVADARESGAPPAAVPDAEPVAETEAPASDTSPDTSMPAPAAAGLASGSMMRLTAAALDQGSGPAGTPAGLGWQTGSAAGTGGAASPGPWVRALAGDLSGLDVGGSVAGVAVGLDAELDGGFRFGTAMAPEAQASSADGRSRLSADVWTARLGWSAGGAFADAALAYGRSRTRSRSVDTLTGGVLDGVSGLAQSHVQATAGHRVSAGPLVAVPSLSLFAGSLEHDARTARSAVLRTEAPGFTQGYHGWKVGLSLGTKDWLSGSGRLRWRPHLRAEWERLTDEEPETLPVRKAGRAGVLSFVSEERVAGLPHEVLRLDLGAELRGGSDDAWGVGFGYTGARTDGETEHGVQASFALRF